MVAVPIRVRPVTALTELMLWTLAVLGFPGFQVFVPMRTTESLINSRLARLHLAGIGGRSTCCWLSTAEF